MGTLKFNQWQNPDGTENYKCRAWVNFDGTGTVAIRASGNVTSITDNGTGDYTVNFTASMPDANYTSVAVSGYTSNGVSAGFVAVNRIGTNGNDFPATTTACRVNGVSQAGDITDTKYMNLAFFR
jgi:hypothetical protein